MPTYIIKVNRDDDRYVGWSTVTGSPHMWGTHVEVVDWLVDGSEKKEEFARPEAEQRILRADVTGSSAFARGDGDWDDDGFIVQQRGWLPRHRLGEFLDTFNEGDESFDWSMLDSFADVLPTQRDH